MPLQKIISLIKKIIPESLYRPLLPAYHFCWALGAAIRYRFPARKINIVMVTGTKGKTTTAELLNAILEEAGYKTALASTLRFKIGDFSEPNKYKMSVPGRGLLQMFLRSAVDEGCQWVVMEMTSQAVIQSRHRFLFPNALIFTNMEPEHIESHGSYENYLEAKLKISDELNRSPKTNKIIVANTDDKEGQKFMQRAGINVKNDGYSLQDVIIKSSAKVTSFTYEKTDFSSVLLGTFNIYNLLAAIKFGLHLKIRDDIITKAISDFHGVRGRLEKIDNDKNLNVFVDYAHTPESLRAVYKTFADNPKICVLGGTGGGRDTWKRPLMAKIADEYCEQIILTDEDPYDEDPREIVEEIYEAIEGKEKVEIEMDRRVAIRKALQKATPEHVVLMTGKGTDPYIMRAKGDKEPWDEATIVREELEKI